VSDAFFHWYSASWSAGHPRALLQALEQENIRISNPGSGGISILTNGPESWGEQVFVSWEEFDSAASLAHANEVNFQLWLTDKTDVVTRIRRLQGGSVSIEFGLDGLLHDEQERVITSVAKVIRSWWPDCLGFVIDRRGPSLEINWDEVITKGQGDIDIWPVDALGVRQEIAARHPLLAREIGHLDPPLVIFGSFPSSVE
jgi:hypothetical protein